ncbi:hypothetical protein FSP39_012934 [Pinctada imbricata]|uniref:MARVEL domain-containing protein n=1 Tax=Pinctada imbricata TaxID=66713 RepID=A0AA88XKM3_PINIB|nr:hypothetical protein FSP39_012934 [Pinctada imbricata]
MRGSYPYYCIGYHGIYQFYDWVSGSVFFSRLILYILFTVSIEDQHCPQIVPWLHLRVIILGIFTVFYFAASIAMAAGVCSFGVFITAMVLGFIITPVLGADLWFSIQEMRNRPHPQLTRHTWEERRTFTTWEERSTVQVAVF